MRLCSFIVERSLLRFLGVFTDLPYNDRAFFNFQILRVELVISNTDLVGLLLNLINNWPWNGRTYSLRLLPVLLGLPLLFVLRIILHRISLLLHAIFENGWWQLHSECILLTHKVSLFVFYLLINVASFHSCSDWSLLLLDWLTWLFTLGSKHLELAFQRLLQGWDWFLSLTLSSL